MVTLAAPALAANKATSTLLVSAVFIIITPLNLLFTQKSTCQRHRFSWSSSTSKNDVGLHLKETINVRKLLNK
ncbi:hypothetical protein EY920_07510 [Citrobacter braakii]|nr:hypothetical protein EY920_07510 [Citrobacter braakii]